MKWLATLKNGRIYLTSSHLLLLFLSIFFFGLQRSWEQIICGLVVAVVTELGLNGYFKKYPHASIGDRVLSSVAEAAGLLILLQSEISWFYGFASLLAVSSKYLIVRADNTHIFNPTNFAIVLCLAVLPFEWLSIWPDEFNVHIYPIMHVIFFGILATHFGKTWRVTAAYACTVLLIAAGLSGGIPQAFTYWAGSEFGARGLIFMFLMITDPKTVPKNYNLQIFFGVCVGVAGMFLKYEEVVYSKFIALFIVTSLFLLREYEIKWPVMRNKLES